MNDTGERRVFGLRERLGGIGFGGDYNPEQWPEETWEQDVLLMREAGVNLVTVGVFGWATVQPKIGRYDFSLFDKVMNLLAEHGIAADLATMTASPPPWLAHLYPASLPVTAGGATLWPGARQHYSPSSRVYRRHASQLVERLARHYAGHPALALWHVGNEYGCHVAACYSDASATAFRGWLKRRYGHIDALNEAWSTAFWSQRYGGFAEVLPPREAPAFRNPAQQLDYARFSNDALLALYQLEAEILRRITPDVPVTTNYPMIHKPVDMFGWAPHLDVVSLDYYQDPGDPQAHVAAALSFDITRSARGGQPWLLMEQAAGAVNWRAANAPKRPGQMRLWSWQAVAQGADAVLFFQWRQSRGGSEKFHSAMVPHGGPGTRTFRAVRELGAELAMAGAIAGSRTRNTVALLLDWENWWAVERDGQPSRDVRQWDLLLACYAPLFAAGIGTDVVHPAADLSGYRLVVAPSLYLLETPVASALAGYVRAGGHLVVTFFSGIVDARDQVHPGGYPGPLRELLGLRVEEFWPLAAGDSAALRGPGEVPGEVPGADDDGGLGDGAAGTLWSEEIVTEDAETIAEFADTELAGLPAVTRHPSGAGVAWYLGTLPDPATLRALLGRVAAEAEVSPVLPGLPDGVQATVRQGAAERFVFLLNHAPAARDVRLPAPMRDLLSGAHDPVDQLVLPPRGVAVLSTPS